MIVTAWRTHQFHSLLFPAQRLLFWDRFLILKAYKSIFISMSEAFNCS